MPRAATALTVRNDPVLAKLHQARLALSQARTMQEAKQIADIAKAAEIYARRQKMSQETIAEAHAVQVEALRRIGEMLKADPPKNAGARGIGKSGVPSEHPTLAAHGLDKKTSSRAQKLFELPTAKFAQVRDGAVSVAQAIREVEHQKRPAVPFLETGTYRVFYADPPWRYGNSGVINDDNYGRAARHYPSMTIEALCALPVRERAAANAVLFLWVTSPLLAECFAVIEAWGFTYKALFVWDKVRHNFGHYNSVRQELLLICTRGSCTPDVPTQYDSVVSIERSARHSEKPEEFRTIIDGLYPPAPRGDRNDRIELFARTSHPRWDTWGNEATMSSGPDSGNQGRVA
jgi:N6-adenosine-specific RNA methylase IME4